MVNNDGGGEGGVEKGVQRRDATRSSLSGTAGDVVQARDVSGGVHFHGQSELLGPVPRQLPGDVRGFVNRLADLERLDALLANGETGALAVCVIAGTAGVGKTSLAVRWSHRAKAHFPDGQLYINLRGYDPGEPVTPMQALERFLHALHTPAAAIPVELEARSALFRSLIADKRILVVLDNAATVGQIRPLLPGAGSSLALVTSRNRMSGLVARDGALRVTLDVFAEGEAVQLLRATTAAYRSEDSETDIAEMARLCARLPLALRIAAERAAARPHMPLVELIRDLRDESSLWDALSSDEDEESDAVRAVFAWSYRALPEDAARMFRLLGIHPGPEFSCSAAAALAGVPVGQARRLLDILVGAYLLEQVTHDRYQFHDLLRAYAIDQVRHQETPESQRAALERELNWYLYTTIAAVTVAQSFHTPAVTSTPPAGCEPEAFSTETTAIAWYDSERTNLVAITRVAAESGFDRLAWQLPAALYPIHHVLRNPFADWVNMGRIGLQAVRRQGDRHGEAALLTDLGNAYTSSHQPIEAERYLGEALTACRETGDLMGEIRSTNALGWVSLARRQLPEALARFGATRSLAPDSRWKAVALINLAVVRDALGQPDVAAELAEQALDAQENPDQEPRLNFDALHWLARFRREIGQWDEAERRLDEADRIVQRIGGPGYEATLMLERGHLHRAREQYDEGLVCFQRAAVIARKIGDREREAAAFDGTGEIYRGLGRPDEAADFHRRAAVLFGELNDSWQQVNALDHLAAVLDDTGHADQALRYRRQSLTLIDEFRDPLAEALRERLRSLAT